MDTSNLADAHPANGIVWAYRFETDGSAALIPNDEVEASLASHDGAWIWVHFALADTRCRSWIAQHAPVSEIGRDVLSGPDRHLRLDILGQEIVGVVPDLHQDFAQPGQDLVRLRFVMTERMLITARQHPAHSVETNRRAIESGKRFPTAISFLELGGRPVRRRHRPHGRPARRRARSRRGPRHARGARRRRQALRRVRLQAVRVIASWRNCAACFTGWSRVWRRRCGGGARHSLAGAEARCASITR